MAVQPLSSTSPAATARLEQLTVQPQRPAAPEWGSDVIVEMLRRLDVPYVALNPGASYRGLHDSLVNYNGNQRPGIILCNHEEVAVAIAHGYGKAMGRAMGAIVHSNVGLLHATMAIYNAWCDRMPALVMGATGPMDASQRRPWIEWIHTSNGQSSVVRDYTKWDNQPGSVEDFPEALLRAWQTVNTPPMGPAYVCFDVALQEQKLDRPARLLDPADYPLPRPAYPHPSDVEEAARLLVSARYPLVLLGRGGQTDEDWRNLVDLAEAVGAAVITDTKTHASFPTDHPLVQAGPTNHPSPDVNDAMSQADVILALDRVDPEGALRESFKGAARPKLINVSLEQYILGSWASDYQPLPRADVPITSDVPSAVVALLEEVRRLLRHNPSAQRRVESRTADLRARHTRLAERWEAERQEQWNQQPIALSRMVGELHGVFGERAKDVVLAHVPLAWAPGVWDLTRPLSYLGADGGGGVGGGPGISVGAALGLRGSGRPVVSFVGDGDLLMANTALWTAAHHQIPLLLVVANNRTYMNDEVHQVSVARRRGRPVENRWVGQRMEDPEVSFAGLARDMGVESFGPVRDPSDLADAYRRAVEVLDSGQPALVDVHIARR